MPSSTYYSFLLCAHPGHTDVYYNGLPLGVLVDGKFNVHQFKQVDGSLRSLTTQDLPHPCPFKTVAELQAAVTQAVNLLDFK